VSFFFVALLSAIWRWVGQGDTEVFATMVDSLFSMAKLSVEVMVLLFGTLTLWLAKALGFQKVIPSLQPIALPWKKGYPP